MALGGTEDRASTECVAEVPHRAIKVLILLDECIGDNDRTESKRGSSSELATNHSRSIPSTLRYPTRLPVNPFGIDDSDMPETNLAKRIVLPTGF